MANVAWPQEGDRRVIGKRISRVDGPVKVSGEAKYSYDINREGMLHAKAITSPYALAKLISVDLSAAEGVAGYVAAEIQEDLIGDELRYCGQVVGAVVAETEEQAIEARNLVKLNVEVLEHQVVDSDLAKFEGRVGERTDGDVDKAFEAAAVVSQGQYGMATITHCCLESHGQVIEITKDNELLAWPSTQNVSGYAGQFGDAVNIPQNKVKVDCQHMGGGFGSKFGVDNWGILCAKLAQKTGRPVKLMLERDTELKVAGSRPSAFANARVGLHPNGLISAVEAEVWGTGGNGGFRALPIPYVFTKVENTKLLTKGIRTNTGSSRAWRAPAHPQGCLITMSAAADAAALMGMDELDFFLANTALTDRPEVYREELRIAANIIGYRQKAHLRDNLTSGPVKRGLGISLHTWGGRGHPSECDVSIHSDGTVEAKLGSQDLGVGTRTCVGMVVAETLGLPHETVNVQLGRNAYPASGASGGSTTIGGISVSSRRAATDALNALLQVVAGRLGTAADNLEAVDGHIRQMDKTDNRISWKDACAALGANTINKRGVNDPNASVEEGLIDAGVGGVQIADVSVDVETGVVSVNEMVAVQDIGLIINMKLAESQVYGALIMGITYSLFEESVYDPMTGQMLNADMEFYRLAGIKDVGKLKVHMMTGKGYDERGVIGLGEPPVISPGAAISNAVANAIGVRVPHLPLTPDRVIDALQKGGNIA